MHVHDYLGGRGSIFNSSIVENVIYHQSTVQQSWIRLILIHNQAQISHSLGPTLLGVQSAHERGSVAILIEPALVLFPPSNCTLNLKLIVLVGSKYGTLSFAHAHSYRVITTLFIALCTFWLLMLSWAVVSIIDTMHILPEWLLDQWRIYHACPVEWQCFPVLSWQMQVSMVLLQPSALTT